MSAHDVFFVQSRPAHEFPEHALQENIGPGTYTMLAHQLHWCGCMIGSAVAIMNGRPLGRPHIEDTSMPILFRTICGSYGL